MPDFDLEESARRDGFAVVAGVDEAGRGPWAGPVVAGAVILEKRRLPDELHRGLDDSKKLSPARREELFEILEDTVAIGIGRAEASEIDGLNILEATMTAMTRAVAALSRSPDLVLVDGNREPRMACPVRCVVGGDGLSLSIAAASIAAKVTRDRVMAALARDYPGYGWEHNAGYGTAEHRDAIRRLGVTPEHRRSFRPIHDALARKI